MRDRNPEISLMPEFDSEEAFNSNFAKAAYVDIACLLRKPLPV